MQAVSLQTPNGLRERLGWVRARAHLTRSRALRLPSIPALRTAGLKLKHIKFAHQKIRLAHSLLALAVLLLAPPCQAKTWRVFLLAGQSNMEGVGVAAEAPSNLLAQADVRLYHSSSVRSSQPANQWNPLKPAGISAANFGPELASAFRLAEALPGENIALIKHAKGGTKLTTEPLDYEVTSWHPGTNAADTASFGVEFATFVQTVTNALDALRAQGDTPVLSGMFWVQGEADATVAATGAAYAQNLARFVRRVREQFGVPGLPIVCARILPYQTRPGSVAVRQALDDADQNSGSPAALTGVFTVHTEGLGVNADSVHFNTPGQLGLGALLADSMIRRGLGIAPLSASRTLAYWPFDEPSNAPYLLDAVAVYHLDKAVAATAAPALAARVSQAFSPRFLDGSSPLDNSGSLLCGRGMRRQYDDALDMRGQAWTFEAFFKNNAAGTQTVYEVIGGTRSALSDYKGWRVIMINGQIRFFATSNNVQNAQILTSTRYDDGKTHHLAAVWSPAEGSSGKMRLYLDGVLKGEVSGLGDLGNASTNARLFAIGGNVGGTAAAPVLSNTWNGNLDEVRFTLSALRPTSFLTAFPKATVLSVSRVDPLERVYPDQTPATAADFAAHVPRGGRAYFQVALQGAADTGSADLSASPFVAADGKVLAGKVRVQVLRDVPVEANYCGCAKTQAGKRPPRDVLESVVRQAPFRVYEVLTENATITFDGRATYAAVARLDVPRDARPGLYRGRLSAASGGKMKASSFLDVQVHAAVLPERQLLDATHWLWPEPQNLTDGPPPSWWSEGHWRLLEASGLALRDYGDTVMFTPLFSGEHPLITVSAAVSPTNTWAFDFSRFDRWVTMFQRQGFSRFIGQHIGRSRAVMTRDPATGAVASLKFSGNDYQQNFLPAFYTALYGHLSKRDWLGCYLQALADEPKDEALAAYRQMSETFRKHMPGVGNVEALNHAFNSYSAQVDVPAWWYGYVYSGEWPDLVRQRVAAGKANWIYYACSPRPPHPNSHLDAPLWRCRALPWVADYCLSSGVLHWAANGYRGADPYTSSVGPLPNGSTAPGHPPGDNWLFYPTARGLTGSMRMAAFQQGVEDYELLVLLRKKDPVSARQIADSIVRAMVLDYPNRDVRSEYANNAGSYHEARQQLLVRLDALTSPL